MKLVSCIMPTARRPEFMAQAIQCFLDQTYPNKELVIVDDMQWPSLLAPPTYPGVRYYRENPVDGLGLKRNRCCHLAQGDIICHFDDDDYSEPERIEDQVQRLEESGKQVTGYKSMLFYDERHDPQWGRFVSEDDYALGTSLCYTKSWWHDHPFVDVPWFDNRGGIMVQCIGEDNEFVRVAIQAKQFICVDGLGMQVARIHPKNTSPSKNISDYRPFSGTIPAGFLKLCATFS